MDGDVATPGALVVVGSINVDLVVRAAALPRAGETVLGRRVERFGGGKGANAAVAAARLGAAVAFVGAVGDDAFGEEARAGLVADGIAVGELRTLTGESTGAALIVVDGGGENQIAVGSGANGRVEGRLVEDALGRLEASCLLVSMELPFDAVASAVELARRRAIPVIVNPAPADARILILAGHGPILTPNAHEATTLTGEDDPMDAAVALAARTMAPAIVTAGAAGVHVALPDGRRSSICAVAGIDVRDTTGAGDTFNGALAAQIADGAEILDAARFAVAAAACAVRADGARAGMPTRAEVEALLRSSPTDPP
jgi:ribokinase